MMVVWNKGLAGSVHTRSVWNLNHLHQDLYGNANFMEWTHTLMDMYVKISS